jgi:hypothetical protein
VAKSTEAFAVSPQSWVAWVSAPIDESDWSEVQRRRKQVGRMPKQTPHGNPMAKGRSIAETEFQ